MKKITNLITLGIAVFSLAACAAGNKVSEEKFKEEVNKLEEVKVASVKISGKYDDTKVNLTYEWPQSAGQGLDALIDGVTGKYNEAESAAISTATSCKTPAVDE